MSTTDPDEQRLLDLEARIRRLEDHVAICQLLASYGPAADSRSAEAVSSLWTEDGHYDFGGEPLVGAAAIGSLVDLDTHLGYVQSGCAHVIGMPLVNVDGDGATATGYSRVYVHQDDGWKVERASANRWELVRTARGWRVANRVNRLLDGSAPARELLARGVAEPAEGVDA